MRAAARFSAANAAPSITLRQLADQYNAHATVYYRKHGRSTREAGAIKEALAVAVGMYCDEPVNEFGPLKLQLVRDAMVGKGWSFLLLMIWTTPIRSLSDGSTTGETSICLVR